jgi:hypothetical protein
VSTALVDEGRTLSCPSVQLAPMGMSSFGELIRSVAHSLLPFAWRKGS